MSLKLGDLAPDFAAETNEGKIDSFHKWIGDSWAILFSHPADYTPVCTTELSRVADLSKEFASRNTKLIALSCDSAAEHNGWIKDIESYGKLSTVPFPIIADQKRVLAVQLGMIDPDERTAAGLPLTARAVRLLSFQRWVFIFGPDKKLKLSLLYPATTGRNFAEIVRVLDSLQLTAANKVATPVDWQPGQDCMVVPSLSDAEATKLFPKGFKKLEVPSGKAYLRMTPDPR